MFGKYCIYLLLSSAAVAVFILLYFSVCLFEAQKAQSALIG